MGRFTEAALALMAPGRSPEELATLDMDDGEFAKRGAELRADHAATTHALAMVKAEMIHEIDNLRFDPDVIEHAKKIQAQNPGARYKLDDVIEGIVAPAREALVAKFATPRPPAAPHRVGLNEAAFKRLLGDMT